MARTVRVSGIVTAQNIQKFDDTRTELEVEEVEKSNIDILNIDCGLD
jgi:hypothetical protein